MCEMCDVGVWMGRWCVGRVLCCVEWCVCVWVGVWCVVEGEVVVGGEVVGEGRVKMCCINIHAFKICATKILDW